MVKGSQKTQFAAIVVYRLDRIGRSIGDFAKLIEELGNQRIGSISIREERPRVFLKGKRQPEGQIIRRIWTGPGE